MTHARASACHTLGAGLVAAAAFVSGCGQECGGFAGGNSCVTVCSSNDECSPGYTCAEGECVADDDATTPGVAATASSSTSTTGGPTTSGAAASSSSSSSASSFSTTTGGPDGVDGFVDDGSGTDIGLGGGASSAAASSSASSSATASSASSSSSTGGAVATGTPTSIVVPVTRGEDDLTEDDLGLIWAAWGDIGVDSQDDLLALRFGALNIPVGSTVLSAVLELDLDDSWEDNPNEEWAFEKVGNVGRIDEVQSHLPRRTTARTRWVGSNIGSGIKQSPSLAPSLQELVDSPAWMPGGSVALLGRRLVDNAGTFSFYAWDYDAGARAPRLRITFQAP